MEWRNQKTILDLRYYGAFKIQDGPQKGRRGNSRWYRYAAIFPVHNHVVSESKNITPRQAFLRDIAYIILVVIDIMVDILLRSSWKEGDSKRRAIHDFIAGTVVVRTDEFERAKLINESFHNAGGQ
jgi:hypothetical protein